VEAVNPDDIPAQGIHGMVFFHKIPGRFQPFEGEILLFKGLKNFVGQIKGIEFFIYPPGFFMDQDIGRRI
jgi:hypothetical protein